MNLTEITPNLIASDIERSLVFDRELLGFRSSRPSPGNVAQRRS